MKYYIIAGEASGDLHASNLMKALKEVDKEAEFRCYGGEKMQAAGGFLVKNYKETAVMGFLTVLKNLDKIKANMDYAKSDIKAWKPDVMIFVDYPGFNLRIAEYTHKLGIKNYYYISPKIWAWKKWRIKSIRKYIDEMFCIFPFEVNFFKELNYKVHYEGNPLVDEISKKLEKEKIKDLDIREANNLDDRPIISLLAGSRIQELKTSIPEMLKVVDKYPDYQFVIAGAPSLTIEDYEPIIGGKDVKVIFDQTYGLLINSRAALVTSGTATLETALLGTPQVVCYKTFGGAFIYHLMKAILNIKFVSLVNIIMQKQVVVELLQHYFCERLIIKELDKILKDGEPREKMLKDYRDLSTSLGEKGVSERFADRIYKLLKQDK